jgi:hypothetical protein
MNIISNVFSNIMSIKPIFYLYNFYTNVLALKTKYFLLTAFAIYLCIGKDVKKYRYYALVIMLYASFLAYQLNPIYGYLWFMMISFFITINDIFEINKLMKWVRKTFMGKEDEDEEDEITDLDEGSPSVDTE